MEYWSDEIDIAIGEVYPQLRLAYTLPSALEAEGLVGKGLAYTKLGRA